MAMVSSRGAIAFSIIGDCISRIVESRRSEREISFAHAALTTAPGRVLLYRPDSAPVLKNIQLQ
jgi:hypothetical protein